MFESLKNLLKHFTGSQENTAVPESTPSEPISAVDPEPVSVSTIESLPEQEPEVISATETDNQANEQDTEVDDTQSKESS